MPGVRRLLVVSVGLFFSAVALVHGAQMDRLAAEFIRWSTEVERHVPGHADDASKALGQWPWERLAPILSRLFDRNRVVMPTLFLRAAVIYGDISLSVPREQRPVYPGMYTGADRVTLAKDGQSVGVTRRDTHLRLAHEFVRRVVQFPQATGEHRRVAADWYVAQAAALAAAHDLAGLKDHLEEAREQFPEHAEIQFVSGCLAESLASPDVQAARRDANSASQTKSPFQLLQEQSLARTPNLERAKHHYQRALGIHPQHSEARIRLAHVLMVDARAKDALALLEAPFETADLVLSYYRYLFLGRAYHRMGKLDEARQSYDAAAQIFPDAQSPWVALSALAAGIGDGEGSRAALERIIQRADALADPWWQYDACSGRNATRIYQEFAESVSRLGMGSAPREGER
jgi:tetratricopeptide (TPR) repeat protein